jgi:hypothetical protein
MRSVMRSVLQKVVIAGLLNVFVASAAQASDREKIYETLLVVGQIMNHDAYDSREFSRQSTYYSRSRQEDDNYFYIESRPERYSNRCTSSSNRHNSCNSYASNHSSNYASNQKCNRNHHGDCSQRNERHFNNNGKHHRNKHHRSHNSCKH